MVESILAFREGATNANNVKAQFVQREPAADRHNWVISRVSGEATVLASGQHSASGAAHSPAPGFLLLPGCSRGRVASLGKPP